MLPGGSGTAPPARRRDRSSVTERTSRVVTYHTGLPRRGEGCLVVVVVVVRADVKRLQEAVARTGTPLLATELARASSAELDLPLAAADAGVKPMLKPGSRA